MWCIDSAEVIVAQLAALSPDHRITLGPTLFRSVRGDVGCAPRQTLDYLPVEPGWEGMSMYFRPRRILGKVVFSRLDINDCMFRNPDGCAIFWDRPLGCRMRRRIFIRSRGPYRTQVVGLTAADLPRRADPDARVTITWDLSDKVWLHYTFVRYLTWAEYFGIETAVPKILRVIESVSDVPRTSLEV